MQAKENKLQKEYEEKLKTVEVIIPMNSDERLKKFHNHIYKLSDKAERNKKLFMEYNEKSKNNVYYNYLSKRYTNNDKEVNKTLPYGKELPLTQKFRESIKRNLEEVNKNQTMFNQNMNISKEKFKKKEIMNNQRTLQEEKRIKEKTIIIKTGIKIL